MEELGAVVTVQGCSDRLLAIGRELGDAERVDLLRALEELKATAAAVQVDLAFDLDGSQREAQRTAGVRAARVGVGVGEQVALARREAPHRGRRLLGVAKALGAEMPHALEALRRGLLSERRAELLVCETAYLSLEHRRAVDEVLAGPAHREHLATMGDRSLVAAVRKVAHRLDPQGAANRARRAEAGRRVTLRPAPDTMSYLTALLPVADGVACLAALERAADSARAVGDPRTRGQVMADELVAAVAPRRPQAGDDPARVGARDLARPGSWAEADSLGGPGDWPTTDRPTERATAPASVPTAAQPVAAGSDRTISLQLVMTDRALFRGDSEPAHLVGYGTVPAGWARDLVREAGGEVWLRRLYTHPTSGQLLGADRRSRLFTGAHREVLVARDQVCRTPWCDAPVRHLDHPRRRADGGATTLANGQGLCEQCNYAKEAPGWTATGASPPDGRHTVTTVTPTGHVYRSRAPAPPGAPQTPTRGSVLELFFHDVALAG